MGVVYEAGSGNRHLATAIAIDRMGDALLNALRRTLEQIQECLIEGQRGRALGLLQAAVVCLDQYEELDAREQEHWQIDAPRHVGEAADEGREIVRLTEKWPDGAVS